jgi:hypothetical protein
VLNGLSQLFAKSDFAVVARTEQKPGIMNKIKVSAFGKLEETTTMAKNTATIKDEAAAEQPKQPNHTDMIKTQVLVKIGKLPRFDHMAISPLHNGKYRVNIWQQIEPDKDIAITIGLRIGLSYYLTVSDTGEIIDSNPPMTKLGSQA